MNKVIEKCKALCEKELAKLEEQVRDAEGCYRDTGYDRYYKKMCKCEDEIDEITKFVDGDSIAKSEAKRYQRMYNELNDSLYFIRKMMDNLTEDDFTSPRVNEILNQLARIR